MSPKIYTQEFKETAVRFYERNHTIAETLAEFGIGERDFLLFSVKVTERLNRISEKRVSRFQPKPRAKKELPLLKLYQQR